MPLAGRDGFGNNVGWFRWDDGDCFFAGNARPGRVPRPAPAGLTVISGPQLRLLPEPGSFRPFRRSTPMNSKSVSEMRRVGRV